MITAKMLQEAMTTSEILCVPDCIHEAAMRASERQISDLIGQAVAYAISAGVSPALMVWSAALHIGYRLHQLEMEPPKPETIN